MPIKMITRSQVPEKKHNSGLRPGMKSSKEWMEVVDILKIGLKPHEGVEIDLKGLAGTVKNPATLFRHYVQKEIARLNAPFDCWTNGEKFTMWLVGR